MSVWGKILGGAAGFALCGPTGALVGALAGHAVDRLNGGGGETAVADGTREPASPLGVLVLGAKLAKAAGPVHRKAVDPCKQVFPIPAYAVQNGGRGFPQSTKTHRGFDT